MRRGCADLKRRDLHRRELGEDPDTVELADDRELLCAALKGNDPAVIVPGGERRRADSSNSARSGLCLQKKARRTCWLLEIPEFLTRMWNLHRWA